MYEEIHGTENDEARIGEDENVESVLENGGSWEQWSSDDLIAENVEPNDEDLVEGYEDSADSSRISPACVAYENVPWCYRAATKYHSRNFAKTIDCSATTSCSDWADTYGGKCWWSMAPGIPDVHCDCISPNFWRAKAVPASFSSLEEFMVFEGK
eukprot:gnl/TRDRNA2_/TRDRNA2_170100_c8_seq1.p1 gnl/TRDRNA2_/TRDRNA2_170100_c8~~gnl/TRDRNA2_/TRDRNA2_170100_c8_seq1.p1  ORF type:complete len:155 (+),score=17.82 gnl/TRDRNA2_/TRDRNA2_170100_c8_seq1:397-861(+)